MYKKILSQRIPSDLCDEVIDYIMVSKEEVKENYNNCMLELFIHFMVMNLELRVEILPRIFRYN